MDASSAQLLEQFRRGDATAAEALFLRYVERLTRLARARLSPQMARRLDAEDVVLSAYRSFFLGAGEGEFTLERSGDLWRLLVAITLNKLRRQVQRHRADKRAVARERSWDESADNQLAATAYAEQPSVADALAAAEELEQVMADLDPLKRRILELRLQDAALDEIAAAIGRSERTVRRMLIELQATLERRLLKGPADA